MKNTCFECTWCREVDLNAANIGTKNYICCFNPPQVTHIPVPANGGMGIMAQASYPAIQKDNMTCSNLTIDIESMDS